LIEAFPFTVKGGFTDSVDQHRWHDPIGKHWLPGRAGAFQTMPVPEFPVRNFTLEGQLAVWKQSIRSFLVDGENSGKSPEH
jgi:hypothetical protein